MSYSTIGIEGFICGASSLSSPSSSLSLSSEMAMEMTGIIKKQPEDFIVKELLSAKDNNVKFSKIIPHYHHHHHHHHNRGVHTSNCMNTSSSNGIKCNSNENENNDDKDLIIASMALSSVPTMTEDAGVEEQPKSQSKKKKTKWSEEQKQEQHHVVAPLTVIPVEAMTTTNINSNVNVTACVNSSGRVVSKPESDSESLSWEEIIIQTYLKQVAIPPELSATSLRKSLEELEQKAMNRIPMNALNQNQQPVIAAASSRSTNMNSGTSASNYEVSDGNNIDQNPTDPSPSVVKGGGKEVWIPPLTFRLIRGEKEEDTNGTDKDIDDIDIGLQIRTNRRNFHQAIKIKFPFLKTESSKYHRCNGTSYQGAAPTSTSMDKNKKNTGTSIKSNNPDLSSNANDDEQEQDHWIKVTVEDCFDGMIEYLHTPREDLRRLLSFRNRGFEGVSTIPSTFLRLQPNVSKESRRTIHHILAKSSKHFESSMRNNQQKQQKGGRSKKQHQQKDKSNDSSNLGLKSIIITWKKQALAKDYARNKNNNNKRKLNDVSNNRNTNNSILCVLKKTQKEHLSAMQTLQRILRCRQSDIGFAGIKDMKAITYQFITLRGMNQQHVERIISRESKTGRKQDVELKLICSNVGFVLNVGDLKGNYFEITVRDLKQRNIKVEQQQHSSSSLTVKQSTDDAFSAEFVNKKELFVDDCDSVTINRAVERINKHGFINFYGEQRIGHPGVDVGVRGFEIGIAMMRQDYMEAINLLMKGTRHRETEDHRRVRQAWKDSNGNPATTLKAFPRGVEIMPRECSVLKGLKRYPNNPLEALRFLNYSMRMFYIHAYQSYIFNQVASQRIKLYGGTVGVVGDLYFVAEGDDHRDSVKIVNGKESPPIKISQVVLPLPGYDVQYPTNEIGQFYEDLLVNDNVRFEKNSSIPESTAKGSYRKLVVHPDELTAEIMSPSDSDGLICKFKSMKLSFQLPKGCYATMLLRELMMTTVIRSDS